MFTITFCYRCLPLKVTTANNCYIELLQQIFHKKVIIMLLWSSLQHVLCIKICPSKKNIDFIFIFITKTFPYVYSILHYWIHNLQSQDPSPFKVQHITYRSVCGVKIKVLSNWQVIRASSCHENTSECFLHKKWGSRYENVSLQECTRLFRKHFPIWVHTLVMKITFHYNVYTSVLLSCLFMSHSSHIFQSWKDKQTSW